MVLAVCTIYRSQVNATSPTTSTVVAVPACTSTDGQTWPSKECCSRQLARRRHCRATGMGAVTTGALGAAAARRGGDPNRARRRGALREAAQARAAAARRARGRSGSSRNSSGCVAPHAAPNTTAFGCGSVSGWRAALACLAAPRGGFCMAAHGCMASSWRVDDLTPGRRAALVVAPETAVPQSRYPPAYGPADAAQHIGPCYSSSKNVKPAIFTAMRVGKCLGNECKSKCSKVLQEM